jgi:tetratricopeptide (TPR) repeat protein
MVMSSASNTEAETGFPASRGKIISICILLSMLVWLAFWPVLNNDFTSYDDPDYVTANVHVQQGLTLENIKWAFSSTEAYNWHPLTWLSHMADWQFFGPKPWGHHLTNLLLHTANTVMVFLVIGRMTKTVWRSFFVAAMFGLHPMHVESVAWVSERKDVLSTFFGLLTLLAYVRHVKRGTGSFHSICYWLALVSFALSLMSKPMLVTLPCILLLLDYWPLERLKCKSVLSLLVEKVPFLLLAAIVSAITFIVQKKSGAMVTLPLYFRAENALVSYCRYLGKLFWPVKLSVFYPFPYHWPAVTVLCAFFLLAGISIFVFMMRHEYPYLLVGWLWFAGTLVPVIGLVQVGVQSMADRYSYVPAIGVFLSLTWSAYELMKRWGHGIALSIAALVIFICIVLTRQQVGNWSDGEKLFRHAMMVTKNNPGNNYVAYYNLGIALLNKDRLDEAIQQLEISIKLNPNYARAHNNMGIALEKKGLLNQAIGECQQAVKLDPNYADAYNNLGVALGKNGQSNEAVSALQESARLRPDSVDIHYNLGNVLARDGRLDEAINQYQEALKLNPDDTDVHNNLGIVLYRKGRLDEAINQFQEALKLEPNRIETHQNLNIAMQTKNTFTQKPAALTPPETTR